MRLRTSALLVLSLALTPLAPLPAHAAPHPDPAPDCAASTARRFPLTTRIHGGPDSYAAGGGHGDWSLDLTNTTDRPCAGVHPVVVLVDERRDLKPGQVSLEFSDGPRAHRVRFEATEEDELVGAFGGRFPGFTVAPGRTLTVRVRLAIASDAVPNEVTANAAVVRRRAGDGDWVGQSNDYRFRIEGGDTEAGDADAVEPGEAAGRTAPGDPATDSRQDPPPRDPRPSPGAPASATPTPDASLPLTEEPADGLADNPGGGPTDALTHRLAATGLPARRGALAATGVLFLSAGSVLLLASRRR